MAKSKGETKTYLAKTRIDHNREEYAVDEEIELADAEAAPLLAIQAVEGPLKPKAQTPPPPPAGKPDGKVAKIPTDSTKDGKPNDAGADVGQPNTAAT